MAETEQRDERRIGIDDALVVVHHDGLEGRVGEGTKALLALSQRRLAPLQLGDADPERRVVKCLDGVGEPLMRLGREHRTRTLRLFRVRRVGVIGYGGGRYIDRTQDRESATHRAVGIDQGPPEHVDRAALAGLADRKPKLRRPGRPLKRRDERSAAADPAKPRRLPRQGPSDHLLRRQAGQGGRGRAPYRDPPRQVERHHAVATAVDQRRGNLGHGGLGSLRLQGGSLSNVPMDADCRAGNLRFS